MKSFSELKTVINRLGKTRDVPPLSMIEKIKDKEDKEKEKEWQKVKDKGKLTEDKRYVIGCDPFSDTAQKAFDKGLSIFFVYDKVTYSVTTEIKTKKTFQEICEELLRKANFKNQYVISDKFIKDGRACSLQEARVRVESHKGLNATL